VTKNEIAISSLAMDLKRVALGYYKGSDRTASRFAQEVLKRKEEINDVKPYIKRILNKLPQTLTQKDKMKLAEYALMYSTLLQNYVLTSLKS